MLQQQHVWHCTKTLSVCPWHASPSRSPGIRPSVGSSHFLEVEKFGQVKKETRFGHQEWQNRKNRVSAVVVASGALTENSYSEEKRTRKPVYFVDIHALCYEGSKVRPSAAMEWMKLLFAQVTQDNPVIAVMDGERGNEYRRALMPSYKSKRNRYRPLSPRTQNPSGPQGDLREALPLIHGFLSLCHVPVVKLEMAEADDVVATLVQQAVNRGFRAVVASPDMDFRKLLSPDVCMLLPLPEFGRWSFYTLEHYVAQNQISPELELGLRCLLGDSSDSIPGLPELATGFGRKTALKLIKKHGSLEELLNAVAKRTVGKPYVQEALTLHAPTLWRNLQVLSLRRDLEIILKDEWCQPRKSCNDTLAFQLLEEQLQRLHRSHKSAIFTHR